MQSDLRAGNGLTNDSSKKSFLCKGLDKMYNLPGKLLIVHL